MLFVKTADLKPGMRLAKPIYNRMGVLLYERDTRLTFQGIHSIQNFGLIGIYILEPAEPVPPLSREDLEFEQLQTVYMFQLKENLDRLQAGQPPASLLALVKEIQAHYGVLDHKLNFTQNLRSSTDFVYKHAVSVAILSALISNQMRVADQNQAALITASLLYDFGYLYVPPSIFDKGEGLSDSDREFIQLNLERGYETLRPQYEFFDLPEPSLEIIRQAVFRNSASLKAKEPSGVLKLLTEILKAADRFDRLTAMNINKPPISEVAAMKELYGQQELYHPAVLAALSECIHILPKGACVDLSDGEKALVLEENPDDFMHPMILKFSSNSICDLSDPSVGCSLKVLDIMKTMDNRIAIDEHTLEHFVADSYIRETADRFRRKKLEAAQRRQAELQKQLAATLEEKAAAAEEPDGSDKKPQGKMKLL